VRIASQQQLIEEQQLARKAAVDEWAASVRDAINSGQLISPSGNNARELLDAREAPAETRNQLARELFAALIIASEESLGNDNLVDVEAYLRVASELDSEIAWGAEDDGIDAADLSIDADNDGWGDDNDTLAAQRDSVEEKLIAAYGNKVVGLADFVRVKATPAQYPVSAGRRNITGWVEVRFTVTKSGITENIEVVQAEPADVFDDSAIEAVRSWTFEPREYRGQSINQRTVARLVFNLE
jgi:TonB family protein